MNLDVQLNKFWSRHQMVRTILTCCALLMIIIPATADDKSGERGDQTKKNRRRKIDVVAHWKFQNATVGSSAKSEQLIEDSSGNSRHGRAIGGPKFEAAELSTTSTALVFDGRDDRIAVPDDSRFYLTESFTIEAWINIRYYAGSRQNHSFIVFRGDVREGFDPWYICLEESGQLAFMVTDLLNNNSVVMSPAPLPIKRFVHVAAVMNHETGMQSVFVDGERVASVRTKIRSGGALGGVGPGIGIGGRQDHSHQGYSGSIAEIRISANALTPSQFLNNIQE